MEALRGSPYSILVPSSRNDASPWYLGYIKKCSDDRLSLLYKEETMASPSPSLRDGNFVCARVVCSVVSSG